jgi:hypothetical protein
LRLSSRPPPADAGSSREVIDVVTADLTKDPRHEE